MRWNECQNNSPQIPLVSIQMFSWFFLVGGEAKWILREMNEIRRPDVGSCKIWGTGDFTQSVRCSQTRGKDCTESQSLLPFPRLVAQNVCLL